MAEELNVNRIDELIERAEIMNISVIGTVSKKGQNAYKKFINNLKTKRHNLVNDIKPTLVWDRLKKIESVKNVI